MNIAIITGGTTGERDVSISSAHNVVTILASHANIQTFIFPQDRESFDTEYTNFDVVIPMIHGKGGEDGELQEYLNSINMPYIFSKSIAHAIGIDKIATKKITQDLKISVPKEFHLDNLSFPIFAKPQYGGSTVSSAVCNSLDELKLLMTDTNESFLLEEIIKGREFSVGVIDMHGTSFVLPVTEIIHNGTFDYESKYNPDKLAQEVCPASIDDSLCQELGRASLAVHNAIGARHISRSDFIVTDEGLVYFLEINTIPGMTKTSLIPNMLRMAGIDPSELLINWCREVIQ